MTADELRDVVQRELAGLIAIFAKLLRAKLPTGPNSHMARAWIAENPDACVSVVLATEKVAGVTITNDPDRMVACAAEAAFAAARQQVAQ